MTLPVPNCTDQIDLKTMMSWDMIQLVTQWDR